MPTPEEIMSENLAASYKTDMEGQGTNNPPPAQKEIVPPIEKVVVEEKVATPAPIAETPVGKSFEDYLIEKSEGKFKSWDELKVAMTPAQPEALKFANEKIEHLNELAKKGIDVTSKEFLELQSIDVEKADTLFEKWKRSDEGRGLSDETIKYEINKKYNVDEWANKEEADLTLDDKANKEKMLRDINLSKEWLTNYKNERVLEKPIDPKVSEALAEEHKAQLLNWDKQVDTDIINKVSKLSTPISYKDETGKVVETSIDYNVSAEDMKYAADLMKNLPRDSNAFFRQFQDEKGNQNHEALVRMIVRDRGYDKAMAESYTKGAEQRALIIEKASKNTNFAPSGALNQEKVFASEDEAIRDAFNKQK